MVGGRKSNNLEYFKFFKNIHTLYGWGFFYGHRDGIRWNEHFLLQVVCEIVLKSSFIPCLTVHEAVCIVN